MKYDTKRLPCWFLLLLLCFSPALTATGRYPAFYHQSAWLEAEKECLSSTRHLATFTDVDDLKEWHRRNKHSIKGSGVFIGLSRPAARVGEWEWASRAPYSWSAVNSLLDEYSDLNTTDMRALCAYVPKEQAALRLASCTDKMSGHVCEGEKCTWSRNDLNLLGNVPGLLREAHALRITSNGVVSVEGVDAGLGEWVTAGEFRAEVSLGNARCMFEASFRESNGEGVATMGCRGVGKAPARFLPYYSSCPLGSGNTRICTFSPSIERPGTDSRSPPSVPSVPVLFSPSRRSEPPPHESDEIDPIWVWSSVGVVGLVLGLLAAGVAGKRRHHRGKRRGASGNAASSSGDDCTSCNNNTAAEKKLWDLFEELRADLSAPLNLSAVRCVHNEGGKKHQHCFDVKGYFSPSGLIAMSTVYMRMKPRLKDVSFHVSCNKQSVVIDDDDYYNISPSW